MSGAEEVPPADGGGHPIDIRPASLRDSVPTGTNLAGYERKWTFRGLDDDGAWRLLCDGVRLKLPDVRTGVPTHPSEAAMIVALRTGALKVVKPVLPVRIRAAARGRERTRQEVLASDPAAELRMSICRRWDEARRRGDRDARKDEVSLAAWFRKEFGEDRLIERFDSPSATTMRTWIDERGTANDRRWCDMEDLSGQGERRKRVVGVSFEMALWHAARAAVNPCRTCAAGWRALRRDVRRARTGQTLKMDSFRPVEREFADLKEMDRTTFRKLFHSLDTNANARAKTSYDAVRSRRGGGGRSLETSRCWEIVEMDEKELSTHLFVDERRRVPLGTASSTILVERHSTAIVGRDVTWEPPSTASAMRALLHATSLKEVPPEFAEEFPALQLVCAKLGALIVDNAAHYVGEALVDAAGDVVMDVVWAGVRKGTDKSLVESRHGILRTMVDDLLPSRKLPIEILREWNIDPAGRTVIDLRTYLRYFDTGVALYNVTRRADLGNRSPLEILMEDRRLHGAPLPADVEQFRRAMSAIVVNRVLGGDGVVVNGLRYVREHNHPGLLEDFVLASADRRRTKRLRFDAKVKIDPSDLSRVWIYNPRQGEYEELICTKARYSAGLSLALHAIVLLGLPNAETDEVHEDRLLEIRGRIEDAIEHDHPDALAKCDAAHHRALGDPRVLAMLADRASVEFRPPSPTGEDAVPHATDARRADAETPPPRARMGSARNDLDGAAEEARGREDPTGQQDPFHPGAEDRPRQEARFARGTDPSRDDEPAGGEEGLVRDAGKDGEPQRGGEVAHDHAQDASGDDARRDAAGRSGSSFDVY